MLSIDFSVNYEHIVNFLGTSMDSWYIIKCLVSKLCRSSRTTNIRYVVSCLVSILCQFLRTMMSFWHNVSCLVGLVGILGHALQASSVYQVMPCFDPQELHNGFLVCHFVPPRHIVLILRTIILGSRYVVLLLMGILYHFSQARYVNPRELVGSQHVVLCLVGTLCRSLGTTRGSRHSFRAFQAHYIDPCELQWIPNMSFGVLWAYYAVPKHIMSMLGNCNGFWYVILCLMGTLC